MPSFVIPFLAVACVVALAAVWFAFRRPEAGTDEDEPAGPAFADGLDSRSMPRPAKTKGGPAPTGRVPGGRLRGLATFASEQDPKIAEYMRTHWNGNAQDLPLVLAALLTELERDAQSKGLSLDRETLRSMLAVSLRSSPIARGHDLLAALEEVA